MFSHEIITAGFAVKGKGNKVWGDKGISAMGFSITFSHIISVTCQKISDIDGNMKYYGKD